MAPSYLSLSFIRASGFTGRFIFSLSTQLPSDPVAPGPTTVCDYMLQEYFIIFNSTENETEDMQGLIFL